MRTRLNPLIIVLCTFTLTVFAQIEENDNSTSITNDPQPMEEVTVIGQRSLTTIRMQIDRAADRIFDLYNGLNTNKLYEIHCRREASTGSHIMRKTCKPFYMELAEADATQASMTGGAGGGVLALRMTRHNPLMQENWNNIVRNNPEIVEAISEHYSLTQQLKDARKVYFDSEK